MRAGEGKPKVLLIALLAIFIAGGLGGIAPTGAWHGYAQQLASASGGSTPDLDRPWSHETPFFSFAVAAPAAEATLRVSVVIPPEQVEVLSLRRAYDLLHDQFLEPVDSAALLRAAAKGAEAAVKDSGVPDSQFTVPDLPQDRSMAWAAFEPLYRSYVSRFAPQPDQTSIRHAAVTAMADSLKHSHTTWMSQAQYEEQLALARGEPVYSGIGVTIRADPLILTKVFPGSPAANAGLRAGDLIAGIDGQSTDGMGAQDAARQVRGTEGTVVRLTITRSITNQVLEVSITRANIRPPSVESFMYPGGIGYLSVGTFQPNNVAAEAMAAVERLRGQGLRALILDLRGNSGGSLDQGVRLLSYFVREGPLFRQKLRNSLSISIMSQGGFWNNNVPIAVLVDEGSASMAELFASAVQERRVARIVGMPTAGAVEAGQFFPLGDGSALEVTIMEILSASGKKLEGVGVTPDEQVPTTAEDLQMGLDPQLDRAVAILQVALGTRPVALRDTLPWSAPAPMDTLDRVAALDTRAR